MSPSKSGDKLVQKQDKRHKLRERLAHQSHHSSRHQAAERHQEMKERPGNERESF